MEISRSKTPSPVLESPSFEIQDQEQKQARIAKLVKDTEELELFLQSTKEGGSIAQPPLHSYSKKENISKPPAVFQNITIEEKPSSPDRASLEILKNPIAPSSFTDVEERSLAYNPKATNYPSLEGVKIEQMPQKPITVVQDPSSFSLASQAAIPPSAPFLTVAQQKEEINLLIPSIRDKGMAIDFRKKDTRASHETYYRIVVTLEDALAKTTDAEALLYVVTVLQKVENLLGNKNRGYPESAARALLRAAIRRLEQSSVPGDRLNAPVKLLFENSIKASEEAARYFQWADPSYSGLQTKLTSSQLDNFHQLAELSAFKANLLAEKAKALESRMQVDPRLMEDLTLTEKAIHFFKQAEEAIFQSQEKLADCFYRIGMLQRETREAQRTKASTGLFSQGIRYFEIASNRLKVNGEEDLQGECYYQMGILLDLLSQTQRHLQPKITLPQHVVSHASKDMLETEGLIAHPQAIERLYDLNHSIKLRIYILEGYVEREKVSANDTSIKQQIEVSLKSNEMALYYLKKAIVANTKEEYQRSKELSNACSFLPENLSSIAGGKTEELSQAKTEKALTIKVISLLKTAIKNGHEPGLLELAVKSSDLLKIFGNRVPQEFLVFQEITTFLKKYAQQMISAKRLENSELEATLMDLQEDLMSINPYDPESLAVAKIGLYQNALKQLERNSLSSLILNNLAKSLGLSGTATLSKAATFYEFIFLVAEETKNSDFILYCCNSFLNTPSLEALEEYTTNTNYVPQQINKLYEQASSFFQNSLETSNEASFQGGAAFLKAGKILKNGFECVETPLMKESLFWSEVTSLYFTGARLSEEVLSSFLKTPFTQQKVDQLFQIAISILQGDSNGQANNKVATALSLLEVAQAASHQIEYASTLKPLAELLIYFSSTRTNIPVSIALSPLNETHLLFCYKEAVRFFKEGVEQRNPISFQKGLSLLAFAEEQIEKQLPSASEAVSPYFKNLAGLYKKYGDAEEEVLKAKALGNTKQLKMLEKQETALKEAIDLNLELLALNETEEQEEAYRHVKAKEQEANDFHLEAQQYFLGEK